MTKKKSVIWYCSIIMIHVAYTHMPWIEAQHLYSYIVSLFAYAAPQYWWTKCYMRLDRLRYKLPAKPYHTAGELNPVPLFQSGFSMLEVLTAVDHIRLRMDSPCVWWWWGGGVEGARTRWEQLTLKMCVSVCACVASWEIPTQTSTCCLPQMNDNHDA